MSTTHLLRINNNGLFKNFPIKMQLCLVDNIFTSYIGLQSMVYVIFIEISKESKENTAF